MVDGAVALKLARRAYRILVALAAAEVAAGTSVQVLVDHFVADYSWNHWLRGRSSCSVVQVGLVEVLLQYFPAQIWAKGKSAKKAVN